MPTIKKLYFASGTSVTAPADIATSGGSGSGEINLVTNPNDADAGWAASGSGVTVATTTTSTDLPLGGIISSAIKITPVSGTSDYARYRFTIAESLKNRKLKIQWEQRPLSGYSSGDLKLEMHTNTASDYSGTDATLALSTDSSSVTSINNFTGRFVTYFDANSSNYYEIRIKRVAGTTALNITSVIVGPGIQPQGSVVSATVQHSPTISGLGTGSVATSTTDFFYYRSGQNMIAWGAITKDGSAGTGSADVTMTMPSGLTIDTSYLTESTSVSSQINRLGPWNIRNASGKYGHVNPASTTTLRFSRQDTGSSDLSGADVGIGAVLAFGPLVIPSAEWAGSGTVNLAQNDVEAVFSTATTTTAGASDLTSFGYGPQGAAFNAIASTTVSSVTTYRVRAQRPLGPLDFAIIQTSRDRNIWNVVGQDGSVAVATAANTANYGMSLLRVSGSTTDIDIIFGNNGRIPGTTYGGNGNDWNGVTALYWRVLIIRSGAAVGFGNVSEASSGLMPANHANLDNASATRLGLKEYLHGTTYNGGNAPTITGQAGFAADARCVFIPYQMQSGTWRMRFNVRFSQTSGTTADITVNGVTFNKVAPVAVSGNNLAAANYAGRTTDATSSIVLRSSSADRVFSVSSDVELSSKPSWAY